MKMCVCVSKRAGGRECVDIYASVCVCVCERERVKKLSGAYSPVRLIACTQKMGVSVDHYLKGKAHYISPPTCS